MRVFIFTTELNTWNSIILSKLFSNPEIIVTGIYFSKAQGGDKGLKFRLLRLFKYGLDNLIRISFQKLFSLKHRLEYIYITKCKKMIISNKIITYKGADFNHCLENTSTDAEITILIYFNRIIPKKYITERIKIINIHPGRLPEYRGVQPVFWALKNDERDIDISIHIVDSGIDTGPICERFPMPLTSKTIDKVMVEASSLVAKELPDILKKIINEQIHFKPQNFISENYFGRPSAIDIRNFLKRGFKYY